MIISLTPNPLNIQLLLQMLVNQFSKIPQLSSYNQGMMMVQLQASLCLSSTKMTLLEGLFSYPLETMGRDKGQR